MEALAQVLSCPVCLELFTPPVLVLSCAHNFCKKCLEKILIRQNCSHVNGQFGCPMCRKIIHLRGRGITGLSRNILVESILEKFKYEQQKLKTHEQNQLSQICEEHGENMNLVCLTDDKPICAICKLFGDHETHMVAKISEVYRDRKERLIQDLDWMYQQSEHAEETRKEIDKILGELTSTLANVKIMIEAVGMSLLNGIRWRMSELNEKLGKDYSLKIEKLQLLAQELQVPRNLYQQMKNLLEQHSDLVHFLQEDKLLRQKLEKLIEGKSLQQDPKDNHISVVKYFKDLIRGIHIADYISSNSDEMIANPGGVCEALRPECPAFSFSSEMPNEPFLKKVLEVFQKSNEKKKDLPQNESCDENSTPSEMSFLFEAEQAVM